MYIEKLTISNFRCFGPTPETVFLDPGTSIFIGSNGTGKTALMLALLRMFGVTMDQRRLRREDFHVPINEAVSPKERNLFVDVVFSLPETNDTDGDFDVVIPEFFNQTAIDDEGKLKFRARLQGKWTDDGSLDGEIEHKLWAVKTLSESFTEDEESVVDIKPSDRSRIQMVYVPAIRDGVSQVSAFLKSRLWKAIVWSDGIKQAIKETGDELNKQFAAEPGISAIAKSIESRWTELHTAGTDAKPLFRPLSSEIEEFIKNIEVVFRPDEANRDRSLENLSDGQRSIFHIAMTSAILDLEAKIYLQEIEEGFQSDEIDLPALTLIAIEEPENNLAPFYLSRILKQITELTKGSHAQAIISTHSSSMLSRINPEAIRHFQLLTSRAAKVNCIHLPPKTEDAGKFIREAVKVYPEIYFAKFVILGEGDSEQIVIPKMSETCGSLLDPSFVAVVPLGGRHVNHLWKLLNDLGIPFATLLDLDTGRFGGGWGRIRTVCRNLLAIGVPAEEIFGKKLTTADIEVTLKSLEKEKIEDWLKRLQKFNVYFSHPLDLDWMMLGSFKTHYQRLEPGEKGPLASDAKPVVLGENGDPSLYAKDDEEVFRWYRYLFIGKSKPDTHLRVLSVIPDQDLKASTPDVLMELFKCVDAAVSKKTV